MWIIFLVLFRLLILAVEIRVANCSVHLLFSIIMKSGVDHCGILKPGGNRHQFSLNQSTFLVIFQSLIFTIFMLSFTELVTFWKISTDFFQTIKINDLQDEIGYKHKHSEKIFFHESVHFHFLFLFFWWKVKFARRGNPTNQNAVFWKLFQLKSINRLRNHKKLSQCSVPKSIQFMIFDLLWLHFFIPNNKKKKTKKDLWLIKIIFIECLEGIWFVCVSVQWR